MINRLKNKKIEIRQKKDGTFRVYYGEKELKYIPVSEYINNQKSKEELKWNRERGGYSRADHPWKKYGYQWALSKKLKEAMV